MFWAFLISAFILGGVPARAAELFNPAENSVQILNFNQVIGVVTSPLNAFYQSLTKIGERAWQEVPVTVKGLDLRFTSIIKGLLHVLAFCLGLVVDFVKWLASFIS